MVVMVTHEKVANLLVILAIGRNSTTPSTVASGGNVCNIVIA